MRPCQGKRHIQISKNFSIRNATILLSSLTYIAIMANDTTPIDPTKPLFADEIEETPPLTMQTEYEPSGDQPTAISELNDGIKNDDRDQVLLGVTGSGKPLQ